MPIKNPGTRQSIHQQAFDHYLRTGERLTNAEWLGRHERKFNPYHDEIGRFTSPPGVTVSYGNRGRPGGTQRPSGSKNPAEPQNTHRRLRGNRGQSHSTAATNAAGTAHPPGPTPAVEASIAKEWAPEAPILFRFDLNQRQAHLDRLRQEAGPNASLTRKAALEETQRRLDAARVRLEEYDRIADRQVGEMLREGLPPVDLLVSAGNIASGDAELRDYFAAVSAIPVGGTIGKLAKAALARRAANVAERGASKIIQLGGAHRDIKGMKDYEAHHTPGNAINLLKDGDGPSIAMLKEDHRQLPTSFPSKEGDLFRKAQAEHIARGDFKSAIQMDIDQIRSHFGNKYDDAIEQMINYSREKGYIK